MKQQDKLRKTLRDYYDNQQANLNEGDWERAADYINAEKRKRRSLHIALTISGLLLFFLTTAIFYFRASTGDEKPKASLRQIQKPEHAAIKRAVTPLVPQNTQMSNSRSVVNPNPPIKSSPLEHAAVSMRKTCSTTPELQIDPSTIKNMGAPGDDPVKVIAHLKKQTNSQTIRSAKAEDSTGELIGTVKDDDVQKTVSPGPIEDPKDKTVRVLTMIERQIPIEDGLVTTKIADAPAPPSTVIVAPEVSNDKKKETSTEETKPPAISPDVLSTAAFDTLHAMLPNIATALDEPIKEDTLVKNAPLSHNPGEGLFYEAGAAWLYGWKGPVARDARGFSPVVAINYMNRINKHCALSFGLGYQQVNHLSGSSKTSRVSSYQYGEQSRVTVITPSSIHYLIAPLRFHYYVKHSNIFGAGINMAYLLNVDATVMSYDEKPGLTENYESIKLGGYTQGFKWFDSQLAFFYRRRVVGPLAIQAEVFLGLTDVKQDGFFGTAGKEKNSGAKLSLIYYAFKKHGK